VIVKDPLSGAIHMSKLPFDLSSVTTVAVDLAKHVFQVHGCDSSGKLIVAKAHRRKDVLAFFASLSPCLVGDIAPVTVIPKLAPLNSSYRIKEAREK
jgi:hypothetical protein